MGLTDLFDLALKKAENRAKANPRLAVAQGFVETKHYKKRVELLLPLQVEYPKDSNKYHVFALALRKVDNAQKYTGMSLLTMSMAYANARLVGYVDSSWLTNDTIKKDKGSKEDKDRGSTQDNTSQNSASNHSTKNNGHQMNKDMMKQMMPGTMISNMHGFGVGMNGVNGSKMLFQSGSTKSRSRGSNVGQYHHPSMGNNCLPPIPDQIGIDQVNLGDARNGYHVAQN